jgi:ABC-2 type transport system ATP-binding protein
VAEKTKDEIALHVNHISKDFLLPHEKNTSIKSSIINIFRSKDKSIDIQHVLKDVSFEVKKGEFFGILGRNGGGKSTLLKIISEIYQPTSGTVVSKGKLVPFIELGVGFNPELTGRENIYLNGALLGFSRKEIDERYDDIVAFAELEEFMDQKLKNYSSGMQVRLAFSLAIRAEGDILVLDEVLAVGDTNFQRKCNDYFEKIKHENKTVILVTHNMDAVERYCSRAMLINEGKIVKIGDPSEVAQMYSDLNFEKKKSGVQKKLDDKKDFHVESFAVVNDKLADTINANKADKVTIRSIVASKKAIEDAVFGLIIYNSAGMPLFATNTRQTNQKLVIGKDNSTVVDIEIDNIFSNGEYVISSSLKSWDGMETYFAQKSENTFFISGRKHEFAIANPGYKIKIG